MFHSSIAKVIEMDNSEIFLRQPRKFQNVYDEARISARKRVKGKE